MLTKKHQKWIDRAIYSVECTALALAVLWGWDLLTGGSVVANASIVTIADPDPAPTSTKSDVDFAQLDVIWKRDLRQQLIETPKAPPKPKRKPKPKPTPPTKLPGIEATFVEEGAGWGVFVDSKGARRVRGIDGVIDGFEITEIRPGIATLRKNSRIFTVSVKKRATNTNRSRRRG